MKKILITVLALILTSIVILASCAVFSKAESADTTIIIQEEDEVKQEFKKTVVVIDAGHGGRDSGAVGASGKLEKDLNLEYALELKNFLYESGINCVLTRSDDSLLSYGGRTDKTADLRARVEIAKNTENCIFVSIHMNKFADPSVKGETVYYSPNDPESKVIAECINESLKNSIPESGKRPMKASDSSIYVLNRASVPAVLIEYGFISNPLEEELLSSDEYRKRMCRASADALYKYIVSKEEAGKSDLQSKGIGK